jgi:hypothetical protein
MNHAHHRGVGGKEQLKASLHLLHETHEAASPKTVRWLDASTIN